MNATRLRESSASGRSSVCSGVAACALAIGVACGCGSEDGTTDSTVDASHDAAGILDAISAGDAVAVIPVDAAVGNSAILSSRPIAPLSSARVTTQLPTLHWVRDASADGTRVQVCADRACSTLEMSLDLEGDNGAVSVPMALSAGVHFWRLYGLNRGVAGTTASATWEFWVGVRSAATDTSWGTVTDFNGDGYADVATGNAECGPQEFATYLGCAALYLGSAQGVSTTAASMLMGYDEIDGDGFGAAIASAGDVDGDGYPDLAVSAHSPAEVAGVQGPIRDPGHVYIYHGGSSETLTGGGLPTLLAPARTIVGPYDRQPLGFGKSLASVGDLNGDGYADLAVSALGISPDPGSVYVYLGGATGLQADPPALTIVGPSPLSLGEVAGAGDLNGDGYGDFVVVNLLVPRSIQVYLGNGNGASGGSVATMAMVITSPVSMENFGTSVANAGDVNGDGLSDLLVGSPGGTSTHAYLYYGHADATAPLPAMPSATIAGDSVMLSEFGGSVSGAGDFNADGYDDIAVGDFFASEVFEYMGSASGVMIPQGMPITLSAPSDASSFSFGNQLAILGDVDGDGSPDLAVPAGNMYIYGAGQIGNPLTVLTGPFGVVATAEY